jgi:hypothetical protein
VLIDVRLMLNTSRRDRKRVQQDSPIVYVRSRTTRGGHSGSSLESQVDYAEPQFKSKPKPKTTRAQPKRNLSDVKEEDDSSSRTASGSPAPSPAKRVKQSISTGNLTSKNLADSTKTSSKTSQAPAGAMGQNAMHDRRLAQSIQTHDTSFLPQAQATDAIRTPTDLPYAMAAAFAGDLIGAMTTPVVPKNPMSSSTSSKPARKRKARMPNLPPTPELRPQPDDDL